MPIKTLSRYVTSNIELIGTAIEPNDLGRLRGNDAARRTAIESYDADAVTVLDWLTAESNVSELGAIGFCIGGQSLICLLSEDN
jgi:carboxymethylenebutenolidase